MCYKPRIITRQILAKSSLRSIVYRLKWNSRYFVYNTMFDRASCWKQCLLWNQAVSPPWNLLVMGWYYFYQHIKCPNNTFIKINIFKRYHGLFLSNYPTRLSRSIHSCDLMFPRILSNTWMLAIVCCQTNWQYWFQSTQNAVFSVFILSLIQPCNSFINISFLRLFE